MALSNMLNEPRREITETVVGLAIVAAFLAADYYLTAWIRGIRNMEEMFWQTGVAVGVCMVCVSALLIVAAYAIHALGEGACNRLEDAGVQLRPRDRRRRR